MLYGGNTNLIRYKKRHGEAQKFVIEGNLTKEINNAAFPEDFDGDGLVPGDPNTGGDACDLDIDGDTLSNDNEAFWDSNPFNPDTAIEYDIPQMAHVKIVIYTLTGQKVKELINKHHEPGHYQVMWHGMDTFGNSVSSGMYLYFMEAGSFRDSGKLVLIR